MLLSDQQIASLAESVGMIRPFARGEKRPGRISYGVTSYGYDIRVGNNFRVFRGHPGAVVDPKNFDASMLEDFHVKDGDYCEIPPNSFALAESVEALDIPRSVLCVVVGKSTYARCGIILNVTPLEPEWRGKITLEISNTTPLPARIYAGEGIAQVLFFRGEDECGVSYADKGGKYQNQTGLELPKVD